MVTISTQRDNYNLIWIRMLANKFVDLAFMVLSALIIDRVVKRKSK